MSHSASLRPPHPGLNGTLLLDDEAHVGGEGSVYFTTDGKHALKVFHKDHAGLEQHLRHVMEVVLSNLTSEQERFILPPLALLDSYDGHPRQGFVMRRVPPRYREAIELVLAPAQAKVQFQRGRTWGSYLLAARSMSRAIHVVHKMGCAHSDIHYKNFLVDIDEGDAVMMEADGLVTAGYYKSRVNGLMGFMAPEILARAAEPSERTDRHSLAILILHTLLFRNPLEPLIEYAEDPAESDSLGWGAHALFSEHPQDPRHRPPNLGQPFYKRGTLSYQMLTPELQWLTERSLMPGLHDPASRPMVHEWLDALAKSIDQLWHCPLCDQLYPYPHWQDEPLLRGCPFCGQRCRRPLPVVMSLLEERSTGDFTAIRRTLILGNGSRFFADMAEPHKVPPWTRASTKAIGHIEWDAAHGGYRIVNDGDACWSSVINDASAARASVLRGSQHHSTSRGQSIPLHAHTMIRFGAGQRAAIVDDPGG